MTAGSKRMVILHATHRGYMGHAGMSPRLNFGRGWGKPKRVPINPKTTLPHGEKKWQKGLQKVEKSSPHKKNVTKRPPHREKKLAERPLNDEKGPPKGEKHSKRAFE